MNCYECHAKPEPAVAVCRLCGKGLCREHTVRQERKVYRHVPSGMAAQVKVCARTLPRMVCAECAAAVGTEDADSTAAIGVNE